jgi:FtsH-binding integral membrane protein
MDKKAIVELLKSFGRFIWFGVLGLVVAFLASIATNSSLINSTWTIPGTDVILQTGVAIITLASLVAKAIDRYIHENDKTKLEGIAPSFLQK